MEMQNRENKHSEKPKSRGLLQFFIVAGFVIFAIVMSQIKSDNGEVVTAEGNAENTILVETTKISPEELPLEFQTTGTVRVRNYVDSVPQVWAVWFG